MKERGDNMRILVISDSHGQLGNLNEILKEAGKVDRVIHLGDAVGQDEEIDSLNVRLSCYNFKSKLRFLFKE